MAKFREGEVRTTQIRCPLYLACQNLVSEVKWKSLSPVPLWPHGLYSPWNSPGQNTGVGSLSILQVIFPTQGSVPGLPHCRRILYQLSHKGSPRILEWVAYPSSRGVFLTQELNRDLPHCKRILYQLSYQCLRDSLLTLHRLIQSQPPESSLRTQLGISCGSATLGHVNGAVTWSIFLKE